MDKIVDRLKSPVFWSTLLIYLLNQLGISEIIGVNDEGIKTLIDMLVTALVALGLLNNPEKNCFTKDKNK